MKLSELDPKDIKVVSEPKARAVATPQPVKLSELDSSDIAVVKEPGLLGKAFEFLDRYGSAPMRAAYGKAQDSLFKKGIPLDVVGAAKAAYDQFGEDPAKAPSAEQLVEQNPIGRQFSKQGFKEAFASNPTMLGARALMSLVTGWDRSGEIVGEVPKATAGLLVGALTDPLTYAPGAVIEKPLVMAGQKLSRVAPGLINRTAGAAEFFTGVPKESWRNYISRNKEVKELEKTFGPQVQDAADTMREGWKTLIDEKKAQKGLEIEQAILAAPKKAKISVEPILVELNNAKMGLNPNIPEHLSAIKEIDNHIGVVKALAPNGKLTARDAFDLQKTLQGRARNAYSVDGALFNPSPQSAKAAREAARVTRQFVNQAMPDVAKANEAFSALHDIDDKLRASLITPGKSNAGLMGAVGKTQNQDTVALRELGEWLNKDLLSETRDFATYKHMQGLGADASDKTGKAVYRAMMGGLLGAGGGYASSDDAKIGLIAGGLAGSLGTNPKLWRSALDAGIGAKNAATKLGGKGGLLEKGVEKVSPTMRALGKRLEGAGGKAKEFIKDEEGAFSPDDLFKILKPGEENVFDLKKARGMAGEPKGLLPGEGGAPVAKYRPPLSSQERRDLLDWIDGAYNTLRRGEKFKPVDEQYLREVLPVAPEYQKNYVKDLLEQIEKQKNGGAEEIAKSLGGRPKSKSIEAAKTAEAERIRKGLIGVDFGGRGGKMPKAKVDDVWADYIPHFPKSGPKLNQKVSFGGSTFLRQGKVVGRDGRNYIVDDGRMTHSVRPEDIAKPKPKGKPKKKK